MCSQSEIVNLFARFFSVEGFKGRVESLFVAILVSVENWGQMWPQFAMLLQILQEP